MKMSKDPMSDLILPTKFIDQKVALKAVIDKYLEEVTYTMADEKENYFLMFNGRYSKFDSSQFEICPPIITYELPPFKNNSIVWWISPKRGIREILWVVPPVGPGEQIKIEFNTEGVAYLQAKGAMPKEAKTS